MIRKALILAGGKGTRLASVVSDKPKPMAEVCGLPFLHYILLDLKSKGIQEIHLITGYMHEMMEDYFGAEYHEINIYYHREQNPRGTGGFVYELSKRWREPILLINGDTYFDVDIQGMYQAFLASNNILIAVKKIYQQDRYGVLEIEENIIKSFQEKKYVDSGFVNGGTYILPKDVFHYFDLPVSFSLEKDFFEVIQGQVALEPHYSDGYFIDIGIPEDYFLAQKSIPRHLYRSWKVSSDWTLFIDRDGVLNQHLPDDYVRCPDDFIWIQGSKETLGSLSRFFKYTIVVTNQQGIGKGLMSEIDLEQIHWRLIREVETEAGKIDRIYHSPHLKEMNSSLRKPQIGMALQAKNDFHDIEFTQSIMIGDMPTDMEFGLRAGMKTINVGKSITKKESLRFQSLRDFYKVVFED